MRLKVSVGSGKEQLVKYATVTRPAAFFFPYESNEEGCHGNVVLVVKPRYSRVDTCEKNERTSVYAGVYMDESFNERNKDPQWDEVHEFRVYSGKEPVFKFATLPEVRVRRVR